MPYLVCHCAREKLLIQESRAHSDDALVVCETCQPHYVATCTMCGKAAPLKQRGTCGNTGLFAQCADGIKVFSWHYLCPTCVASVQGAGPWKERRAEANAARARALCEKYPGLVSTIKGKITHVEGRIENRAVHVRLRLGTREGDDERYIFQIEYTGPEARVKIENLLLPEKLSRVIAHRWPTPVSLMNDRGRWLRVSFKHLGKIDTLDALDALLAAAERLEREP